MNCRRCSSNHLIRLMVMHPSDNPVYRCVGCGFLFSPARPRDATAGEGDGSQARRPQPIVNTAMQPVALKSAARGK